MTSHGVVVMAYGTPRRRDEIAAYYTDIRRGRPPSAEQLADLTRRYDAIGGLSPLHRAHRGPAVDARRPRSTTVAPGEFVVALGLQARRRRRSRRRSARSPPPASTASSASCSPRTTRRCRSASTSQRAARRPPSRGVAVRRHRELGDRAGLRRLPRRRRRGAAGIADAGGHARCCSPPTRCPGASSTPATRTPTRLRATAAAVAAAAGLRRRTAWSVAWQSAGRTPEPWLGPDVLAVIDDLAAGGDADAVLVCPCGFVADHLEVLYDLDIEARQRAEAAGLVVRPHGRRERRPRRDRRPRRRVIAAATAT